MRWYADQATSNTPDRESRLVARFRRRLSALVHATAALDGDDRNCELVQSGLACRTGFLGQFYSKVLGQLPNFFLIKPHQLQVLEDFAVADYVLDYLDKPLIVAPYQSSARILTLISQSLHSAMNVGWVAMMCLRPQNATMHCLPPLQPFL